LRAATTKKKHWEKMSLMITDDENILCMTWVDLNTIQYMITMHIINEMMKITYKSLERRHEIFKKSDDEMISFSISIVEYNTHMNESDENAQQRSYYSSHRLDVRYWWSIFIFFLKAVVLNAYKLWGLLYFDSKMTHLKFQFQIVEGLVASTDQTRKRAFILSMSSKNKRESSFSCQWKHMSKLLYCVFCKVQLSQLRKRQTLEQIGPNYIKRRRESQTSWRCSSCGSCCKKKECWETLHS
jgi:hypothetical protein